MLTTSKEEISENIKSFFKSHFKQYFELMENNSYKIKSLEEISYPKLNGMFIFQFIRVELTHLKNLDGAIIDKEIRNLYEDTAKTASALIKFKKGHISSELLFRNYFVAFNAEAKAINVEFDKAKMEKSINTSKSKRIEIDLKGLKKAEEGDEEGNEIHKKLNGELADTLQNIGNARDKLDEVTIEKEKFEKKYLPVFSDIYKKISEKIVSQIAEQVAVFAFSMDRDMWDHASRSKKVVEFFEIIKQSGNMNIQQYMEYHLKNQTSADSKDASHIQFRKKLIRAIKKVRLFNKEQKNIKEDKTS